MLTIKCQHIVALTNDHPLGLLFLYLHIVLAVGRPLGLLCLCLHLVLTTYSVDYILVELTVPWDSSANMVVHKVAVHVKGDQK